MRVYSADSANEVWKRLARDLLDVGEVDEVDSRLGATQEFLHATVEVSDPGRRWVVARTPAMNPAFALAEVVWLIAGRDDTKFLAHWFPQYPEYVGCSLRQQGAYGVRLRRFGGVDQIQRAYLALRDNPTSRQVVLQIWDAGSDLPDHSGRPSSSDVPCNLLSSLKVRRDRLEWLQVVRSNDIDRGLPHNFIQFTILQELMAGWLGLELGSYVHVIDSVHWYPELSSRMGIDDHVIPAENSDRFEGSFETSMQAFGVLEGRMDRIIWARQAGVLPRYDRDELLAAPYENMFAIIAADDARRYGDFDMAEALVARCDNPALRQLWARWVDRVISRSASMATDRDVRHAS